MHTPAKSFEKEELEKIKWRPPSTHLLYQKDAAWEGGDEEEVVVEAAVVEDIEGEFLGT